MVFENKNVLKTTVFFQVKNTVAKSPEYILDALYRQGRERGRVVWPLDHYLVGADSIHFVKHTFGLPVEVPLNSQRRKLIGDHPHRPARGVALWRRAPVVVRTISLDFRRSLVFVAVTEGTKTTLDLELLAGKIGGPFGTIGGNDDPSPHNWIFS